MAEMCHVRVVNKKQLSVNQAIIVYVLEGDRFIKTVIIN